MSDLPKSDEPLVEYPEAGLQRWTFASDDPSERRAAFNYWRGWFGLEEDDEPEDASAAVWLVRLNRRRPG